MSKSEKRHLSGFASFEAGIGVSAKTPRVRFGARPNTNAGVNLCPRNFGPNVLVNQNCLNVTDPDLQGRGQAQNETAIAQNPLNPRQMVAGFNDYRRGDGTCGTAFSSNGGSSWTDSTMPNGFTRGTNFGNVARQYWQAGGDPSVAWDSRGNAYFSCQVFSASMPLPTQFADANGNSEFIGDYTGVSALSGAHPIWSDTRNSDAFLCAGTGTPTTPPAVCTGAEPNGLIANDQQIYTRRTPAS
jgi:hypothetical protein